jgi:hypothetical protein
VIAAAKEAAGAVLGRRLNQLAPREIAGFKKTVERLAQPTVD